MSSDDAQWVRAALAGDRTAFAGLYDRYARLVRAVCFDKTRNVFEAQDLAQEVFLRAYRGLPDLSDPERFDRWLMGITRFVCKEWVRGRLRDRHEFGSPIPPVMDDSDPVEDASDLEALRYALGKLPRLEREAVHAFYLREQSVELARKPLGLSRSGFYRVLQRARGRLARQLRKGL